jgi:aminoglycoside phosphotransferase family enzyme/predicted kinase
MLVVVCGLPGSGKTTFARALAKEINALVLSSDELRKTGFAKFGYSQKNKGKVYQVMFEVTADLLRQHKNVILDATFYKKNLRNDAKKLAKAAKQNIYFVETVCQEKVLKKRIEKRFKGKKSKSDANYKVFKIIQAQFNALKGKKFKVDMTSDFKENVMDIANKIRLNEADKKIISKINKNSFDEDAKKMKLLQTHISFVFLTGDFVYKIKKPVKFSFLDYGSLKKRKEYCKKEVQLNRRLSPEVYLGVVPIQREDQQIKINHGLGKPVEFAVKMKQLPEKQLLNQLLVKKRIKKPVLGRVAKKLADFHEKAAHDKKIKKFGAPHFIWKNFSNFFETRDIVEKFLGLGEEVDFIEAKASKFLRNNQFLFEERINEGRIREGHGDLRANNIFVVDDRIYIVDCVEFSLQLRSCDVAADAAYLAMDLDFHGQPKLADYFVQQYIKVSGDDSLINLLDFYKCYRAGVRVLVEAFKLVDPQIPDKEKKQAKKLCQKYLKLALSYAKKL